MSGSEFLHRLYLLERILHETLKYTNNSSKISLKNPFKEIECMNGFLLKWKKQQQLTVGHTRLAKLYGIVRLLFHIFNDYNIEMSVHINLKRAWLNNGVH